MRIVVKVGTSTLAHPSGLLNIRHTEDLVKVWSDIQNAGHQLIVVSSAATGLGVGKLQIDKPGDITTKQAAAAVGQCELMYTYDRLFGQYNHTVAQMLLTWEDFDHELRRKNLQNTLERLLQLHAIPIINENDPVACEEYSLGDNDTLAALVATCIHADLVVLMSDIDGLYTADPHTHPDARLIPVVEEITPEIEMLAGGAVVSNHPDWAEHAKHLSTQAKADMLQFLHDEVGYNYRMTNVQACLGLAQLERLDGFIAHKKALYDRYVAALDGVKGLRILPFREEECRSNHWFFSLYLKDSGLDRDTVIGKLQAQQIQTRPVWALIHEQADYPRNEAYGLDKALDYRKYIVNLPCSTNLSFEDCDRVIDAVLGLLK